MSDTMSDTWCNVANTLLLCPTYLMCTPHYHCKTSHQSVPLIHIGLKVQEWYGGYGNQKACLQKVLTDGTGYGGKGEESKGGGLRLGRERSREMSRIGFRDGVGCRAEIDKSTMGVVWCRDRSWDRVRGGSKNGGESRIRGNKGGRGVGGTRRCRWGLK